MSSSIAECPSCTGRVYRCTDGADEFAQCGDCGEIVGWFSVGSPAQVIAAPVEFSSARARMGGA